MKYAQSLAGGLILCPLLNLFVTWLVSVPDGNPVKETMLDWIFLEGLLLVGIPYRFQSGRYPTAAEVLTWPLFISGIILVAWWIVCAVLLMGGLRLVWRLWHSQSKRLQWTAAIIMLIIISTAQLPYGIATPPMTNIHVDASHPNGPMPDHQHGFSQGGEVGMQIPGYFENAMQRLTPLKPSFIRIDHVFDYYHVYEVERTGEVRYNWTQLDRVVDAIVESGAQPFICLSYLPQALARNSIYGPPGDWAAWEMLVYQMVRHLNVERHLGIQYWEVWNEPNQPDFWHGTMAEYLQLYAVTARAALRADPTIRLGGPATAASRAELRLGGQGFEHDWVVALLRFTELNNLPLNFLSWHYYDSQPVHYAESVRMHQQWAAEQGVTPQLWLTEWNRSAGADASLDSEQTAALAAAVLTTLSNTTLQQAMFFEVIDNSTQWAGHWGLLRADALVKPVFNTFRLAAELKGVRLTLNSDEPQVYGLASRYDSNVVLLIGNLDSGHTLLHVALSVSGLTSDRPLEAAVYGQDINHSGGSDDLLIEKKTTLTTSQGEWKDWLDIPAYGVRLLKLRLE